MNARSLNLIVGEALADIGLDPDRCKKPKGRQRTTTWLGDEPGFGIRQYPGDHAVYFVQTRMGGRNRTVTIGRTAVLTRHQAAKVARSDAASGGEGGALGASPCAGWRRSCHGAGAGEGGTNVC